MFASSRCAWAHVICAHVIADPSCWCVQFLVDSVIHAAVCTWSLNARGPAAGCGGWLHSFKPLLGSRDELESRGGSRDELESRLAPFRQAAALLGQTMPFSGKTFSCDRGVACVETVPFSAAC
eukprot:3668981-Rhodomonas_salina.1